MVPDPDGTIPILIACVISFFCLLFYGIFSGAQIAMERANERKLRNLYSERPKKRDKALHHMERPQRFLSTTALVRLITTMVPAVLLCVTFAPPLADAFHMPDQTAAYWIAAAILLAATVCLWLFLGNLLSRKLAANTPEKTLVQTMGIVNVAAVLLRPATLVFSGASNAIVRMMGKDPRMEDMPVTEEQILRMVDESEEDGEIAGTEADMIGNIFDFNDRNVAEIMTHRVDVIAVEDTATVQDVVNLSVKSGCSRIPVYRDNIDTIIGIVYVKDLLRYIGKSVGRTIPAISVMRRPHLVPKSKALNELFTEMTERKFQFAVIIDEYGGTEGIVTMEDILESIVGNIQDEYDNEEEEIIQLGENMYTVGGTTSVDAVADLLDVELPEGDYDTIAGMVVEALGNVPDENENPTIVVSNVEFHVLEVDGNRIEKLLVKKLPEQRETEDNE